MFYDKIKYNLENHEDINDLALLWNKLCLLLKNSFFIFVYHMNKPELCMPIKNSYSYSTHNFYVKNVSTTYYEDVTFFINCDVLFNNTIDDYTDMSIIVGGINTSFPIKNDVKNISHSYRITACGFITTAETTCNKLQYLDNEYFIGLHKLNSKQQEYYFNNKYHTIDTNNDIFTDMKSDNKIIFDRPLKEYYKPGYIPKKSWYFIVHANKCKMFQFYKHVEHVPLSKYEQLLQTNINENVWTQ